MMSRRLFLRFIILFLTFDGIKVIDHCQIWNLISISMIVIGDSACILVFKDSFQQVESPDLVLTALLVIYSITERVYAIRGVRHEL